MTAMPACGWGSRLQVSGFTNHESPITNHKLRITALRRVAVSSRLVFSSHTVSGSTLIPRHPGEYGYQVKDAFNMKVADPVLPGTYVYSKGAKLTSGLYVH